MRKNRPLTLFTCTILLYVSLVTSGCTATTKRYTTVDPETGKATEVVEESSGSLWEMIVVGAIIIAVISALGSVDTESGNQ